MAKFKYKFKVHGAIKISGDGGCSGDDVESATLKAKAGIAKQLNVDESKVNITSISKTK